MTVVTTVGDILDAAIHKSLMNDEGRSPLVGDEALVIKELDRVVKELYVEASRPARPGQPERNDYFGETTDVVLSSFIGTVPSSVWTPTFTLAGARVHLTSEAAIVDNLAPVTPAVYILKDQVFSGQRTGDPLTSATLVAKFTAPPGTLTDRAHFIGATTPGTASTSVFPELVGNRFLITSIALYLAVRDGIRDAAELTEYKTELQTAHDALFELLRSLDVDKRIAYVRSPSEVTTVEDIIYPAMTQLGLADGKTVDLLGDAQEIIGYLNHEIQRIYTLAGMPDEGFGAGDFFLTSTTLTVNTSSPPDLPAAAFTPLFADSSGNKVHVVKQLELIKDIAELGPAITIQGNKMRSAGRAADPANAAVITVYYTAKPALMDSITDFIGATTLQSSSTTDWPIHVGDRFLVARLGLYLAGKSGEVGEVIIARLGQEVKEQAALLATLLGVSGSKLTEVT